MLAQALSISNDRVGAEVGQALGVSLRVRARSAVWRRPAGAALVEHENAIVAQRTAEPGRSRWPRDRARCLVSRTPLDVHQVRPVAPVVGGNLAGEHLDLLAPWTVVVERDGARVAGHQHGHRSGLSLVA